MAQDTQYCNGHDISDFILNASPPVSSWVSVAACSSDTTRNPSDLQQCVKMCQLENCTCASVSVNGFDRGAEGWDGRAGFQVSLQRNHFSRKSNSLWGFRHQNSVIRLCHCSNGKCHPVIRCTLEVFEYIYRNEARHLRQHMSPSRPPCFCEHAVNAPYVAGHFQPLLSLLPPLS